jgi:hypothetical protein
MIKDLTNQEYEDIHNKYYNTLHSYHFINETSESAIFSAHANDILATVNWKLISI